MMRFRSAAALLAVTAVAVPIAPAQAQNADEPALIPVPRLESTEFIRVRNVRATIMAFWLDPKNNPEPNEIAQSKKHAALAEGMESKNEKCDTTGAFKLPAGVSRVIAAEPQNALLVRGTDAGIEKLKSIVSSLDKPLRLVGIEIQLVDLSTEDLKTFGVQTLAETPANPNPLLLSPGFVRGNFQSALQKIKITPNTGIITAPRVTAISNLTGALTFGGKFLNSTARGELGTIVFTPTVNNDDTVTIKIALPATPVPIDQKNVTYQSASTILNLRDGDTMAFSHLPAQFNGALPILPKAAPTDIQRVLFLTARIIRRHGVHERVPGADPQ